jgi:SOS-response transcriptional repressor LexA
MRGASERLRWAREQAGFATAADFARAHGIEIGTYRHHENGIRGIRPATARRYAELLGIDPQWLLFEAGSPKPGVQLAPNFAPIVFAPVLSWVNAGRFAEGNPAALDDAEDHVPIAHHRSSVFALEVRGDSMNRVADEGDLVIVDYEDRSPEDGKLYIFRAEGEMTFKRYRNSSGPVRLEPASTNPVHDTIFPSTPFDIVGRVVFILKKA